MPDTAVKITPFYATLSFDTHPAYGHRIRCPFTLQLKIGYTDNGIHCDRLCLIQDGHSDTGRRSGIRSTSISPKSGG